MAPYYKFLDPGRMATHVSGFRWPEPGEWLEVSGPLVPCENGLHVLRWDQILEWAAPELWTVEVDESELIDHGDKVVVRRARLVSQVESWSERTAREFACDCAERTLPIFESAYPGDSRPRRAIEVARQYARGEATDSERVAAGDAAWAAARAAAGAAAGAAARDAAGDAEKSWQRRHLADLLDPETEG